MVEQNFSNAARTVTSQAPRRGTPLLPETEILRAGIVAEAAAQPWQHDPQSNTYSLSVAIPTAQKYKIALQHVSFESAQSTDLRQDILVLDAENFEKMQRISEGLSRQVEIQQMKHTNQDTMPPTTGQTTMPPKVVQITEPTEATSQLPATPAVASINQRQPTQQDIAGALQLVNRAIHDFFPSDSFAQTAPNARTAGLRYTTPDIKKVDQIQKILASHGIKPISGAKGSDYALTIPMHKVAELACSGTIPTGESSAAAKVTTAPTPTPPKRPAINPEHTQRCILG